MLPHSAKQDCKNLAFCALKHLRNSKVTSWPFFSTTSMPSLHHYIYDEVGHGCSRERGSFCHLSAATATIEFWSPLKVRPPCHLPVSTHRGRTEVLKVTYKAVVALFMLLADLQAAFIVAPSGTYHPESERGGVLRWRLKVAPSSREPESKGVTCKHCQRARNCLFVTEQHGRGPERHQGKGSRF